MLGNISDHFVKCMRQVTKGHLYHLLGVSDYYVMYRHRAQLVLPYRGNNIKNASLNPRKIVQDKYIHSKS